MFVWCLMDMQKNWKKVVQKFERYVRDIENEFEKNFRNFE